MDFRVNRFMDRGVPLAKWNIEWVAPAYVFDLERYSVACCGTAQRLSQEVSIHSCFVGGSILRRPDYRTSGCVMGTKIIFSKCFLRKWTLMDVICISGIPKREMSYKFHRSPRSTLVKSEEAKKR